MYLKNATFEEVLDDLTCRFIINVPAEEQNRVERIGFQIEEAHWFYEDFIRELNPRLPTYTLKVFTKWFYKRYPNLNLLINKENFDKVYEMFLNYKLSVPVCGAILLNKDLDKCVCVKGYNNRATWGFPRGKIDIDEEDHVCAIREIIEEIGFDLTPYIDPENYIQIYVRKQRIKLFIIPCVPEHLPFRPKTRKEISRIQWFPLNLFPGFQNKNMDYNYNNPDLKIDGHGRFYLITPFMHQLSKWISKYKNTPEHLKQIEKLSQASLKPIIKNTQELITDLSKLPKLTKLIHQSNFNLKLNVLDMELRNYHLLKEAYQPYNFNNKKNQPFQFDSDWIMAEVDSILLTKNKYY